jgi:hypothetical protein
MPIFELAATIQSPMVAAASGIDVVRLDIWDVARMDRIGSFDCSLSLFGGRLALADLEESPIVVAGAWGVPGVRAHDPSTGAVLWERRDLVRSGPILAGGDGGHVTVAFGDRPAELLEARNGRSVRRLRGVRSVWQSPFATLSLVERTGAVDLLGGESWERLWRSTLEGFALGAATFSRDSVLYSTAVDADTDQSTPVVCRAFDGTERWRFIASPLHSVPRLAWDHERHEWLILEFDFEHRQRDELVRLTDDGEVVARWDAGASIDQVFAAGGRVLVTSGGSLLDTRSGAVSGSLPLDS